MRYYLGTATYYHIGNNDFMDQMLKGCRMFVFSTFEGEILQLVEGAYTSEYYN